METEVEVTVGIPLWVWGVVFVLIVVALLIPPYPVPEKTVATKLKLVRPVVVWSLEGREITSQTDCFLIADDGSKIKVTEHQWLKVKEGDKFRSRGWGTK